MTKLESWLMQACQASGLEVDICFLAVVGDRKPIQSVARIRGLGDANGMLIVRDYDQVCPLLDDIRLAGYGFSVLDEPGDEESIDVHSYQEMFHDWGWPRRTEKGTPSFMRQPRRGFTLLELLVVMVIVGLLASYVAPRYFDQIGKSEVKAARAQMTALDKALGAYRIDAGHFPSSEQGLSALVVRPTNEPRWAGPYLSKAVPNDPWGRAYLYTSPGDRSRDYDLVSLGRDGQRGGTGEDADLSLWDAGR